MKKETILKPIIMKKLLFAIIGAGLLLGSCAKEDSSDVNQQKIWTSYEVFYNQNEDKTHAIARFRFGGATGTLLELTDSTSANVTYNGAEMPYNNFWGGHHLEFAGLQPGGSFVYTNNDGDVYTNTAPSGDVIAYEAGFDTITKGTAQTFTWDGPALLANQKVAVFVGSWTWGEDALFYTEADNATSFVMGVTQMQNLALGTSTVYMDRSTEVALSEGTPEGGNISYKYRCTNATVQVVQ